jgi:hypothetical protein
MSTLTQVSGTKSCFSTNAPATLHLTPSITKKKNVVFFENATTTTSLPPHDIPLWARHIIFESIECHGAETFAYFWGSPHTNSCRPLRVISTYEDDQDQEVVSAATGARKQFTPAYFLFQRESDDQEVVVGLHRHYVHWFLAKEQKKLQLHTVIPYLWTILRSEWKLHPLSPKIRILNDKHFGCLFGDLLLADKTFQYRVIPEIQFCHARSPSNFSYWLLSVDLTMKGDPIYRLGVAKDTAVFQKAIDSIQPSSSPLTSLNEAVCKAVREHGGLVYAPRELYALRTQVEKLNRADLVQSFETDDDDQYQFLCLSATSLRLFVHSLASETLAMYTHINILCRENYVWEHARVHLDWARISVSYITKAGGVHLDDEHVLMSRDGWVKIQRAASKYTSGCQTLVLCSYKKWVLVVSKGAPNALPLQQEHLEWESEEKVFPQGCCLVKWMY